MAVQIPATGLTTLLEPNEPAFDIVFVHGFKGHPERTWTHKHSTNESGSEPPPKVRRHGLLPFSTSRNGVYWPRDLLKTTCPTARILTYGYDTNIRHIAGKRLNQSSVYEIAGDFLIELEAQRRPTPSRPLVFIAHSLGGIIVKEVLRRSSGFQHNGQAHLRTICDATIGIIFFGTPHRGSDPRRLLQTVAEAAAKAVGFSVNQHVVDTLLPTSERLRELRDEFGPMAQAHGWLIHSFQESLGIRALEGRKVVDDTSSYVNLPGIETSQHIGRDHMDMCRFTGLADPEFKKVEAALHRIASKCSAPRTFRNEPARAASEDDKRMILEALKFKQANFRRTAIKAAHAKTCRWLLQEPVYVQWLDLSKLDQHYGFLWIKRKPGAGKSTLMKFAFYDTLKTRRDRIVISFFFNARGDYLEKSTQGMYRSLLAQLLEHVPDEEEILKALSELATTDVTPGEWSIEALKEVFQQVVLGLGQTSVVCFIDALDECNDNEIRDMLSFFERLSKFVVESHIKFEVCLASRHYPHISVSRGHVLVLEGLDGHDQDITTYIDVELKIGSSKLAQEIRADLQKKAAGVFMWVVLVVDMLNKDSDRGRIHTLRARLAELPGDLHGLFRDIMTRDNRDPQDLLHCIQWILFSSRPLTPAELYYALLFEEKLCDEGISEDVQQRFILDSSKGLAEIVKSKQRRQATVQFIHESVRDFFLKEDGLADLWVDLGNNFQGRSHELLRQGCAAYINRDDFATADSDFNDIPASGYISKLRRKAIAESPFLEYAVQNVLYHADKAQEAGIDQRIFLTRFPKTNWIWLSNIFEQHEVRRYTPIASLLYILAEQNLDSLIAISPDNLAYLVLENERYRVPFLAAMATASHRAIRRFLELEIQNQPEAHYLVKLYHLYCSPGNKHPRCGRNLKLPSIGSSDNQLSEFFNYFPTHDGLLLAFLLATKKIQCSGAKAVIILHKAQWDQPVEYGESMISAGILKPGCGDLCVYESAIIRSLKLGSHCLTRGLLDPNNISPFWEDSSSNLTQDYGHGETPSENDGENEVNHREALTVGKPDIANKHLSGPLFDPGLLRYIDWNATDPENGRSLLSIAAETGNEPVVKLLLATGQVDVNKRDLAGQTPLHLAASKGHVKIIKALLTTGEDLNVNATDYYSCSPLYVAVRGRHHHVVEQLLSTGRAYPNSLNYSHRTSLWLAAEMGAESVVKCLLACESIMPDQISYGQTPLLAAVINGHSEIVELLLATGKVSVNTPTRRQSNQTYTNPLMIAVQNQNHVIARLLIAMGKANIEYEDPDSGHTPVSLAKMHGDLNMLAIL